MARLPTLSVGDVRRLLTNAEFRHKRTESSHEHWEGYVRGRRRMVTIDHNDAPFTSRNRTLYSMIRQSGLSKAEWLRLLNGEQLPICGWPEKEPS